MCGVCGAGGRFGKVATDDVIVLCGVGRVRCGVVLVWVVQVVDVDVDAIGVGDAVTLDGKGETVVAGGVWAEGSYGGTTTGDVGYGQI